MSTPRNIRFPPDVAAVLAEQDNASAFVVAAVREAISRNEIVALRAQLAEVQQELEHTILESDRELEVSKAYQYQMHALLPLRAQLVEATRLLTRSAANGSAQLARVHHRAAWEPEFQLHEDIGAFLAKQEKP